MASAAHIATLVRRVLFATDFSAASTAALPHAAALARSSYATLYVAYVIEVQPWETAPELTLQSRIDGLRELQAVTELPWLRGLQTRTVLRHGGVAVQLVRLAEEESIDVIVTGTRGRHGLSHLLLGSAAEQLSQTAPCSVLTVGPHAAQSTDEVRFRSIILLTGRTPAAPMAIHYAADFAASQGAKLCVVHAVPEGPLSATQRESAWLWLNQLLGKNSNIDFHVGEGPVEWAAWDMAEQRAADLVMLGPGQGSCMAEVSRNVRCPVMAVRHAIQMPRFGLVPSH